MRAVYIESFGGPDVVKVGDLPAKDAGAGEVRVQVKAAALNHLDIWVRRGRPGATLDEPHILGSDAAGIIDQVGAGVENVKLGDEVIVNPGVSSLENEFALRGDHSESSDYHLLGFQAPGTYAEHVVVPAVNVQPKPQHLNWKEAAALNLAHLTAWHMLFERARFKAGESVLVHGIGGGVALATLQLAKHAGGKVIVTSSCNEKLAKAKELGAAEGINYKEQADVAEAVKELTGGRGVDIAVDTVGASTINASINAVRRGGRVTNCGVTSGPEVTINLQYLYWNHISLLGSTMGSQEDFRRLAQMVSFTGIKPVMDKIFPLEKYAEAVQRMEDGAQFGKIALTV